MKLAKKIRGKIKTEVRKFRIRFFPKETTKPRECIVCLSKDIEPAFVHVEWYKRCWRCRTCGHIALYDWRGNSDSSDHFATNKIRADYYLEKLRDAQFGSIIEVGTPDDFYFLTELHKARPEVRMFGHDIFPKQAPAFVEMVDKLENVKVDLVYATHVLEHIPDVRAFVSLLPKISKYFIIEIPEYSDWKVRAISRGYMRTKWHYQFFTARSFAELLKDLNCKIEYRTGHVTSDGKEKRNLIAHNINELILGNE